MTTLQRYTTCCSNQKGQFLKQSPLKSCKLSSQIGLQISSLGVLSSFVNPLSAAAVNLTEPANALSLPTWVIHVSSVGEWILAMGLVWQFAEASGYQYWKRLTWGMIPSLGGAMSACTWHLFYNSPDLEWLVTLQSFLTVIGNVTCCIAAYGIYKGSQEEQPQ